MQEHLLDKEILDDGKPIIKRRMFRIQFVKIVDDEANDQQCFHNPQTVSTSA
jgi:hypothetical protein